MGIRLTTQAALKGLIEFFEPQDGTRREQEEEEGEHVMMAKLLLTKNLDSIDYIPQGYLPRGDMICCEMSQSS